MALSDRRGNKNGGGLLGEVDPSHRNRSRDKNESGERFSCFVSIQCQELRQGLTSRGLLGERFEEEGRDLIGIPNGTHEITNFPSIPDSRIILSSSRGRGVCHPTERKNQ